MKAASLDAEGLFAYAVRVLAGRAHSAGELKEKLRRRAAKAADVDATLARLKSYGYLDDRAFAESYAASRLENQGLGPQRVLRDLRERRVAPPVAERTVRKIYQDVDEEKLIEDFLQRKYRAKSREGLFQEPKDLAAAYGRLMRAGFSPGNIIRVLKRVAKDPDLLDGFEPPEETTEE
jgi:regulatory protein